MNYSTDDRTNTDDVSKRAVFNLKPHFCTEDGIGELKAKRFGSEDKLVC